MFFAENDRPGGNSKIGGGSLKNIYIPGGSSEKHNTHPAAPTMSGLDSIYEMQFKRHKKDSGYYMP